MQKGLCRSRGRGRGPFSSFFLISPVFIFSSAGVLLLQIQIEPNKNKNSACFAQQRGFGLKRWVPASAPLFSPAVGYRASCTLIAPAATG
jgi:hypothetical protein